MSKVTGFFVALVVVVVLVISVGTQVVSAVLQPQATTTAKLTIDSITDKALVILTVDQGNDQVEVVFNGEKIVVHHPGNFIVKGGEKWSMGDYAHRYDGITGYWHQDADGAYNIYQDIADIK
jgi:hypothetical protein